MQFLKNIHERITGKRKILNELHRLVSQQQQLEKKFSKLEHNLNNSVQSYDSNIEKHISQLVLDSCLILGYAQNSSNFDSLTPHRIELATENVSLKEKGCFSPSLIFHVITFPFVI